MRKLNTRKVILALSDIFIIVIGTLITNYAFTFINSGYVQGHRGLSYIIIADIIMCVLVQFAFGSYGKLWRYFRLSDYAMCGAGMLVGHFLAIILFYALNKDVSKLFFLVNFVVTTVGVLLFRALFRKSFLVLTDAGRAENAVRTLLVGAGHAASLILSELEGAQYDPNNPWNNIDVVGLVDDDYSKANTRVRGRQVLGTTTEIPRIVQSFNVSQIIFAIPSCDEKDRHRILEICSETGCKIKVIPYLGNLLFDDEHTQLISQATDVKIEDLLGREPIDFDKSDIKKFLRDKVCLVTGGGGSIGSELVRQIAKYSPKQLIILDIYENNAYDVQQEIVMEYGNSIDLVTLICSVRDYEKMKSVFDRYRPNIVFHAAAHKHVPLMETVPEEAVKNNIFGTFNVATLAELYNADKFVMISTDKAVNPTNVMGCTKRVCEMIIQYKAQHSDHTEFVTTRFGNVLGSNGSVIPLFRRQIESGKPITVTHPDVIRYFMTIPEAVSLVLEAGAMAHGGEIFVLDMGEPVRIVTLAENLIRMYGKKPYEDVEIKFTGLRPGEKLFEELLMDEEGLRKTANKKIFIGNQIEIDTQILLSNLDKLSELAEHNESGKVVELLKEIVPTFNHKS
ncbi:MAG: polysaccharide biosynthesis protein [Ruminococcus sp.]|nr:polysaccharide biosynthesis protein [Ruminococcus sp.]